ncbi:hypothetical protein CSW08_09780 [Confluentibacter flavum]|uniref:SGNH hydrolase-type esterase domain-containing protein n=2 Tax=Confluentibacter flavum TaxID=1909700 RepID=A0A2N3HJU8_9FLAO|nr:hypothetical protein CSW08_09780 [Confluentibacter flavum]
MVGYGQDYQLFHKVNTDKKPDYLEMNINIAGKYFKNNGLNSDNQSDLFLKTKTDSTFRVFVQGASTVVGFPFYRGGSFPRMLKHRLSLTFPEKNIEVINTGITAVNSYTLWDLTDEIIDQKPDLVIIYAGHNEYYGALGVGSSISYGNHPAFIRTYLSLKTVRFFQLLENGYYKLFSSGDKKPSTQETTLMEVMTREQRIPYDSQVYHDGLAQYESNLDKILKKYKKHDIPVILSTLVSNEKDIKPFISDSIPNKTQFLQALEEGKPEIGNVAQHNAMAAYSLGRYYLEKNQDSAKKYLHLAKELDFLRFRAPEKINEIIGSLAKKYDSPIIDMKNVFLAHSPQNVIGDELMTEHVHPNVKGQFLMADAFYHKIKALNFLNNWDNYIGFDEAFRNIPITKIDSLKGKLVIEDLKKSWPYDLRMSGTRPMATYIANPTYEETKAQNIYKKIEPWDQVMAESYRRYENDKDYNKALRVAESLIFEYPEQGEVYRMAGNMCLNMTNLEKAAYYFSKCNQLEKSSLSARQLASVYLKLNKIDLARKTLKEAKNRGFNDEALNKMVEDVN